MITVFRRHLETCPYTSRHERRCRCPIHAEGTLGGKRFARRSLDLNSWEAAQKLVRDWEAAGSFNIIPNITLKDATTRFLADQEARGISRAARRKNEILLTKMQEFMVTRCITQLSHIGLSEVSEFRETWKRDGNTGWGPLTHSKYIERLRAFFRFCLQRKWISENPSQFLKAPPAPKSRVIPFTDEQLMKIHAATKTPLQRAFVLVLQYTGLRIGDASQIRPADIDDGRLMIQTQKRKTTVWLPLPPFVLSALESLKTPQYGFYFWSGESKLTCVVGSRRRMLDEIFERAGVTGNPHKFRHTFATTLLLNGTSVEDVARILGNSPKVVEKYYDHFIKERADRLELAVKATWKTPLILVKK